LTRKKTSLINMKQ